MSMVFIGIVVTAQTKENQIDFRVTTGLNIGGLSPIPLPDNIRKIESYNPDFNPSLGVEVMYKLKPKWKLGISPRVEYKGMKVKDEVMYFHTQIQMGSGAGTATFEGAFSGKNYTAAKNLYLGIPVFAEFTPGLHWHYRLGGYFAFLMRSKFEGEVSDGYIRNGGSLGEKIEVTSASFDFADEVRSLDYGIYAGVRRDIGNHFSIDASLQYGLRSAFPSSFTGISFPMYNIYGQIGVGYGF